MEQEERSVLGRRRLAGLLLMALGAVLAGLSRAMGGPVLLELLSGIFMGLSVGTLLAGLLTVLHNSCFNGFDFA